MPRRRPSARRILLLAALILAAVSLLVLFLPPASFARPASCDNPEIVVRKKDASLDLLCNGKPFRTFPATFGANPVGQKEREGDERTPEGVFRVTSKSESERFHRFLAISYPEPADIARARKNGIDKPGGGIGIHGTKPKLAALARAWIRLSSATGLGQLWGPTDGCIGVTNEDVDVLYALVRVGTKVTIRP